MLSCSKRQDNNLEKLLHLVGDLFNLKYKFEWDSTCYDALRWIEMLPLFAYV